MPNLFSFHIVGQMLINLLPYLPITFELVIISWMFSLVLGFGVALIRIKNISVLAQFADIYISFMRGTPIVVQLLISYFGIPIILQYYNFFTHAQLNINSISPIIFVVIALSLNSGAYSSEEIRAGLLAVDRGQIDAARAIGLTNSQTFFSIILPEALVVSLPSLGNQLIGLIKDTSLAFTAGVVELTAAAKLLSSHNYRFFEAYVALAIVYWIITFFVERATRILERRLRADERQTKFIDANSSSH